MEVLITENLCKTYGAGETKVEALKNVSFSVSKGEFVVIVGPSGSGKSTLLNLIGALDTPTSGICLAMLTRKMFFVSCWKNFPPDHDFWKNDLGYTKQVFEKELSKRQVGATMTGIK